MLIVIGLSDYCLLLVLVLHLFENHLIDGGSQFS